MNSISKKYDLTPGTILCLVFLAIFFLSFLVYPLLYIFKEAFLIEGKFSLEFFKLMFTNSNTRTLVLNSFKIGITVTLLTSLLSLPLAYFLVRYNFPGKSLIQGFILVPMIMPPFVGAIGMKQFFGLFGSVNMFLARIHLNELLFWLFDHLYLTDWLYEHNIIDIDLKAIDWFGTGFWGVVLLEVLHLYPIMYLNVAAALANVDPSLEEAAENMGATRFKLFRTVTLPLMLPGYFAGAIIVFIWAFTDLGTPLIFDYKTIPVRIFRQINDANVNPMGYALVVLIIVLTVLFFYFSKKFTGTKRYEMLGRGHISSREIQANWLMTVIIYLFVGGIVFIALLPHISVILTSVVPNAGAWYGTILPENYTFSNYYTVFTQDSTLSSIKNSLFYSIFSTLSALILGVLIAYLLTRKSIPGKNILDTVSMLPLALPGVALAFGYVGTFPGIFTGTFIEPFLDARNDPRFLLIISYAVRRLPYMLRSVYAGLQQTSITLEEASQNLGASPFKTMYKITLPLVIANLVAGSILVFSFSMLEVSDSLILSMKEQYHPITKVIYELSLWIEGGPYIASAMGVLGMILLGTCLVLAGKFLGTRMGELFRA